MSGTAAGPQRRNPNRIIVLNTTGVVAGVPLRLQHGT